MLFMRGAEADRMLMEGATPAQIDNVLFEFGFPMGPFSMSDLAGLDIGWKAEKSTSSTVRELMCESGRRGQKNGMGYYRYDRDPGRHTEVEEMIRQFAIDRGHEQREVTDQEILERLLYPMINEGAKILDEGIAIRGSAIDVVWVNGYGRSTGAARCTGPTRSASPRSQPRLPTTANASVVVSGICHRCSSGSPPRVVPSPNQNG